MPANLDPARLICIDETRTKTNMTRPMGRAERGKRVVSAAPYSHWHTSTCIAGLRRDRLVVLFVCDGAINGALLVAYVGQMLVPNLTAGDIVIEDNLSAHKVAGVREAIDDAGTNRYLLPAYSPDLNPIEQASAKLEALLRACAARTVDALWRALGSVIGCFTSVECKNCFRNPGYFRSG
jgi:transposase